MARWLNWGIGVAVSLGLHAAVFFLLDLSPDPDPVEQQPKPTSRLSTESYAVDRQEARAAKAEAEKADSGDTSGLGVGAGDIAQSRATAAEIASQDLQAQPSDQPALAAQAAAGQALAAAAASQDLLEPATPLSNDVQDLSVDASQAPSQSIPSTLATGAELPVAATVSDLPTDAPVASPLVPGASVLRPDSGRSDKLPSVAPNAPIQSATSVTGARMETAALEATTTQGARLQSDTAAAARLPAQSAAAARPQTSDIVAAAFEAEPLSVAATPKASLPVLSSTPEVADAIATSFEAEPLSVASIQRASLPAESAPPRAESLADVAPPGGTATVVAALGISVPPSRPTAKGVLEAKPDPERATAQETNGAPAQAQVAEAPSANEREAERELAVTANPEGSRLSAQAEDAEQANAQRPEAQLASAQVVFGTNALPGRPDVEQAPTQRVGGILARPQVASSSQVPSEETGGALAPAQSPDAPETPTLPPPAEFATAQLAFNFGDRVVSDPASVATIQAFMAPSELDQSQRVRDDLSAVLANVECARVSATYLPDTGVLELRGHVPDPAQRQPLLHALQDEVGPGVRVAQNLLHLPKPQCGALTGIASIGLPQSVDQFTNQRLIGQNAQAIEYTYSRGQRLSFEITAPDYDAVVYVDYFDADGNVIHLVPNEVVPLKAYIAKSVVGIETGDGPKLNITIGPPYGQEIAVAFASSEPLFKDIRPIVEPAAPYLEFLKERVAEAKERSPDFKGEWVYFFITTVEN